MHAFNSTIRLENAADAPFIDDLVWNVFGPGMTARAAYVLRENVKHDPELSFVAMHENTLIGTVRLTPILIGNTEVLMLGPLAVTPLHKSKGVGTMLMETAMGAAAKTAKGGGSQAVFLVGDEPYYAPFGFKQAKPNSITLPRPADPTRILICAFNDEVAVEGDARNLAGS